MLILIKFLTTENIEKKIDSLLRELQDQIDVSDEELEEFRNILDLAVFSEETG